MAYRVVGPTPWRTVPAEPSHLRDTGVVLEAEATAETVWRRTLPEVLARRLAEARRASGSFRTIAQRVGITHGYLHQLTRGVRCPSRSVAVAMAAELHLDEETSQWLLRLAVPDREEREMVWRRDQGLT